MEGARMWEYILVSGFVICAERAGTELSDGI